MSEAPSGPVVVQAVISLLSPWSLLAMRRLDRVLASEPGVVVEVLPSFEPRSDVATTPAAGGRPKFGSDRPLLGRFEQVARRDGIALDLSRVGPAKDAVAAQTLVRLAATKGTQRALVRALFGAHFLESRDLDDVEQLAVIAQPFGFTQDDAARLATDASELAATRHLAERVAADVTIAPHFTIGGAIRLSGVCDEEALREAIRIR